MSVSAMIQKTLLPLLRIEWLRFLSLKNAPSEESELKHFLLSSKQAFLNIG